MKENIDKVISVSRIKNLVPKKHLGQKELLGLLRFGVLLAVALVAPNSLRILKPLFQNKETNFEYYPYSVSKNVTKLWRKGFVEIIENNGEYEVRLSDKGKEEILKFDLNSLEIKTPQSWDGRWRIVFFDISDKRKVARHYLYRKLKELNFYMLQESVFVHPFPCEKEIKFMREIMGIPHEVKIGVLEKIENDEDLKAIFHSLLAKANYG